MGFGKDILDLTQAEGQALPQELHGGPASRAVYEKLAKLTGQDNLLGSSGEWGLLFAFLARSPRTKILPNGEPALSVADVKSMFQDGRLPEGWQTWPKTAQDWATNTVALAQGAAKDYAANQASGWTDRLWP